MSSPLSPIVLLRVIGAGGDAASGAGPVGVEVLAARLINTLIRVRTEEIALRLKQVGGKVR